MAGSLKSRTDYSVDMAIRELSRKSVGFKGKVITVKKDTTALGNASWAKVDFLVNHNGFVLVRD